MKDEVEVVKPTKDEGEAEKSEHSYENHVRLFLGMRMRKIECSWKCRIWWSDSSLMVEDEGLVAVSKQLLTSSTLL